MLVRLTISREDDPQPVPSHGGPAKGITWYLKLNGVTIMQKFDRYRWGIEEEKIEAPSELIETAEKIAVALGLKLEAQPAPVGVTLPKE